MGISWIEVEEAAEDVLLWRTGVLTEGFPLLFGAPFSIVSCINCYLHYVDILLINTWMDGWMDGWMDRRSWRHSVAQCVFDAG